MKIKGVCIFFAIIFACCLSNIIFAMKKPQEVPFKKAKIATKRHKTVTAPTFTQLAEAKKEADKKKAKEKEAKEKADAKKSPAEIAEEEKAVQKKEAEKKLSAVIENICELDEQTLDEFLKKDSPLVQGIEDKELLQGIDKNLVLIEQEIFGYQEEIDGLEAEIKIIDDHNFKRINEKKGTKEIVKPEGLKDRNFKTKKVQNLEMLQGKREKDKQKLLKVQQTLKQKIKDQGSDILGDEKEEPKKEEPKKDDDEKKAAADKKKADEAKALAQKIAADKAAKEQADAIEAQKAAEKAAVDAAKKAQEEKDAAEKAAADAAKIETKTEQELKDAQKSLTAAKGVVAKWIKDLRDLIKNFITEYKKVPGEKDSDPVKAKIFEYGKFANKNLKDVATKTGKTGKNLTDSNFKEMLLEAQLLIIEGTKNVQEGLEALAEEKQKKSTVQDLEEVINKPNTSVADASGDVFSESDVLEAQELLTKNKGIEKQKIGKLLRHSKNNVKKLLATIKKLHEKSKEDDKDSGGVDKSSKASQLKALHEKLALRQKMTVFLTNYINKKPLDDGIAIEIKEPVAGGITELIQRLQSLYEQLIKLAKALALVSAV